MPSTRCLLIWPVLSTPAGVFTKDYFAFWIFIALCWGFVATSVIVVLPLQESWTEIMSVVYGLLGLGEYVPATTAVKAASAAPEEVVVEESAKPEVEMAGAPAAADAAVEEEGKDTDSPPPIDEAPPPPAAAVTTPTEEPGSCGVGCL